MLFPFPPSLAQQLQRSRRTFDALGPDSAAVVLAIGVNGGFRWHRAVFPGRATRDRQMTPLRERGLGRQTLKPKLLRQLLHVHQHQDWDVARPGMGSGSSGL